MNKSQKFKIKKNNHIFENLVRRKIKYHELILNFPNKPHTRCVLSIIVN